MVVFELCIYVDLDDRFEKRNDRNQRLLHFWQISSLILQHRLISKMTGIFTKVNFHLLLLECGGTLTAPTSTIQSPNYPGLYPHNRYCYWYIQVQPDRRVTFTFTDMDLQDPYWSTYCWHDYVMVGPEILLLVLLCKLSYLK